MLNKEKRSGPAVGILLVVILLAGAVAALHFTGRLQPLIDHVHAMIGGSAEPAVDTNVVVGAIADLEPAVTVEAVEPAVVDAGTAAPVQEDKLNALYRSKFKAPEIGSSITLTLRNSSKKTGTLEQLDESGLRIKTENIEMTLSRQQLAPVSLARCYEDDYVKYMVALHRRREEAMKISAERDARLKTEYEKFMASRGKNVSAGSKSVAEQSLDDVDFKEWMEKNGATELLEARQARIRDYEDQRKKEGREY